VPDETRAGASWALNPLPAPAPWGRPCGGGERCAYSGAVRVDSSVLYVLRRRQWEAAGGRRPGSLLPRPSLLVQPKVRLRP
jgi:hypothetical protein